MKFSLVAALASLSAPLALAVAVPGRPDGPAVGALAVRGAEPDGLSGLERLFRRKGGGGSGSRGGGSSGSGSSGSGSSGSGSSGSGSSGSGSSGSGSSGSGSSGSGSSGGSSSGKGGSSGSSGKGAGSSSSNSGGRTTTGSGTPALYGGGAYYGGGAAVPYRSGATSPSGIVPFAVGAAAGATLAGLAFWPGLWYHPIYYYPMTHPYGYYNATTGRNESKPVGCGCDQTAECGCDDNTNSTYVASLLGNGSYAALNQSLLTVADVNGTATLLVNGTLDNGTTAAGGTDSPSAAPAGLRVLLQHAGWWPAVAAGLATVFVL